MTRALASPGIVETAQSKYRLALGNLGGHWLYMERKVSGTVQPSGPFAVAYHSYVEMGLPAAERVRARLVAS